MAPRILVVEDDPIACEVVERTLVSEGYDVVVAHDGIEAEDIVKRIKPDLITLDLEMPKEWGPRFYRKMVKNEERRDIPIIVISGISDPKHAIKDAVAVIRKPFDEDKLLGIVKRTIG